MTIMWIQQGAYLDGDHDWQKLWFYGYIDDEEEPAYYWDTVWTFEGMNDAIDILINDTCKFIKKHF